MHIALVSLDQVWQDKDANFARCTGFVRQAAEQGCALAVFPEMTLTGYTLDMGVLAEQRDAAPTLARFADLATETGVDILFGACLLDSADGRPRNVLCLASQTGGARPVYAKLHPFTFAGEDQVIAAGETLSVTAAGGLRLGCGICYDLRFPEPFSLMAPTCDALVIIANWPARRVSHWRALLLARAIENQCFVLGVNRIGVDGNGLAFEKSTLAVAPDGTLLQPVQGGGELDIYTIEAQEATRYRTAFPTVRDKRFDLYRRFLEG